MNREHDTAPATGAPLLDPMPLPPIRALIGEFARGASSPSRVLEHCLARIDAVDGTINALPTRLPADELRVRLAGIDRAIAAGEPVGALAGLPWCAKDLLATAGVRTTLASPIFADRVPEHDDPLVARLKEAQAVLIAKSNTPEFGAGSQTFNTVFGGTCNPYDTSRTVGGSSGGAAAALACGMTVVADGSDLAASLRNPASFCGVVGLRPSSFGDPSMHAGAGAFDSLGLVGPMGRSVDDLRLVHRAIHAPQVRRPIADWAQALGSGQSRPRRPVAGMRIACTIDCDGGFPVAEPVRRAIEQAYLRIEDAGCKLVRATPDFSGADECFQTLRGLLFVALHAQTYRTDRHRMKDTVVWNIEQGMKLTADEIGRAMRQRAAVFERMAAFMRQFDAWLLPTAQVLPFALDVPYPTSIDDEPQATYIDWLKSCYWITISGHPALSVPCGFARDGESPPLPVGLQVVGRFAGEESLFDVAETLEPLLASPRG